MSFVKKIQLDPKKPSETQYLQGQLSPWSRIKRNNFSYILRAPPQEREVVKSSSYLYPHGLQSYPYGLESIDMMYQRL